MTETDIGLLPRLLNEGEAWEAAGKSWHTGHPLVRRRWRLGNEERVGVFEVRGGRRMLALDSLFIIVRGAQP